MRARLAGAIVVTSVATIAGSARAGMPQQDASGRGPAPSQVQSQAQVPSSESQFKAIGVSLDRIRRQLREQPPTPTDSLLRIQYHVEVVGKLPPIDVIRGFNIGKAGAVATGGMTHAEFLRIVAPPWRKW